jgi:DNA polymerase-3 subunit epsilon
MNWIARLVRRGPKLVEGHRRALDAYRNLPKPDLRRTLHATRCVVADVESSGISPFRDRLISIGAVAICDGLIRFDQSFEVVLRQEAPSEHGNILVHGIGGTTQVSGLDPAAGLIGFLEFAGKAPLIGFHADFDRVMIARAAREVLGLDPANVWLDLAALAPALFRGRAPSAQTLDDWMRVFGIDNYARHDAVADALATAQLFQIVAAQAVQQGLTSCADLIRLEKGQRWLGTR